MGKTLATEPLLTIPNLIPGVFIKRDNRFLITASINKKNEKCHLHDPGRLKELLKPGAPLLLHYVNGNRKTKYDVIAIKKETWISRWDIDKIVDVVTAILGGLAIIFGIFAFIRKESLRVCGSAAILGGGAIAFQFAVIALGAIVAAIIIAVILSQLDFF